MSNAIIDHYKPKNNCLRNILILLLCFIVGFVLGGFYFYDNTLDKPVVKKAVHLQNTMDEIKILQINFRDNNTQDRAMDTLSIYEKKTKEGRSILKDIHQTFNNNLTYLGEYNGK